MKKTKATAAAFLIMGSVLLGSGLSSCSKDSSSAGTSEISTTIPISEFKEAGYAHNEDFLSGVSDNPFCVSSYGEYEDLVVEFPELLEFLNTSFEKSNFYWFTPSEAYFEDYNLIFYKSFDFGSQGLLSATLFETDLYLHAGVTRSPTPRVDLIVRALSKTYIFDTIFIVFYYER